MRRIRRLPLIVVAVAVALSLVAACSGGGGGSGAVKGQPGKFIIYSADPGNQKAQQQLFQKKFGDPNKVKVQIVAYPADTFLNQFQNAVRSNSEVDGLLINGQNAGFLQANGLLSPVDDLVNVDSFQPAAIDPFKIDGKLWAAGIGTLNTSMLAYNNDIMKKYHLVVPKTFDDIKANVAKLKGTGISLFGFGGATVFQWPMWYMEMLQQTSGDQPVQLTQETLSGKGPNFTAEPYVQAMRNLQQLGASGAFSSGLMGTSNTAAQADFLNGKTAMYWYGSWVISQFAQQAKFDVKIAQFPSFTSGVTPRPVGGVTSAVGLYSKVPSDKSDLARKFIRYVTSDSGNQDVVKVMPQGFNFPVNKGVHATEKTPLERQVATEFIPQTFVFLDWLWPSAVTTAFQQNIQAVIGQQKSPEAAMKDIQAAYESSKQGH